MGHFMNHHGQKFHLNSRSLGHEKRSRSIIIEQVLLRDVGSEQLLEQLPAAEDNLHTEFNEQIIPL